MSNVWITGAARTPIGRFLGELAPFSAPQLAGVAIRASMERSGAQPDDCLLYTSPSPRDRQKSRMPSSA